MLFGLPQTGFDALCGLPLRSHCHGHQQLVRGWHGLFVAFVSAFATSRGLNRLPPECFRETFVYLCICIDLCLFTHSSDPSLFKCSVERKRYLADRPSVLGPSTFRGCTWNSLRPLVLCHFYAASPDSYPPTLFGFPY